MLAPDDITLALDSVKKFYLEICLTDKTAYMAKTFHVYPVLETSWMHQVQANFERFSKLADQWNITRIGLISTMTTCFSKYSTAFSVVHPLLEECTEKKHTVSLLEKLEKQLTDNIARMEAAYEEYHTYLTQYKSVIDQLKQCIEQGWTELSASEEKLLTLSEKLYEIQVQLTNLEGEVSMDSLNSMTVNNLKDIYTRMGSISYSMIVNGLSVPYLSVGILAFSFGKSIYDLVSNANKYESAVHELQQYSRKFSLEQKAMAQTKMVIRYLYDYFQAADKQSNSIKELISFWKNEKRNLETVKNSFIEKSEYRKNNSEILQLPVADTVWTTLKQSTEKVPVWLNHQGEGTQLNQINVLL